MRLHLAIAKIVVRLIVINFLSDYWSKMKYLGVNFAWAVLVTFFFFANCQTASGQESEEVCISIPRGPAGPQGPMGPPGEVIQCVCNYTDFEDEIRSQQGI